jgi:hypothetical protein
MGANPLFAGGTFDVFGAGSGGAATNTQEGTVVGSVKYNSDITANIDEQSTLVLNLDFLNESAQLDVVSVNKSASGVSYSATSASMDILNVAVSNGVMLGSFNYNGKVYKFKPADNGDTLIVEMDDVADKIVAAPASGNEGSASLSGDESASIGCNDDGKKIDVVVAYTPEFVDEVGGKGNVDAYIAQLKQETNLSFQLSGVSTRVDIVDTLASKRADSTNFKKDWNYYKTGLGSGQALRDLRESKYADIMVVLTGNMGYDACGIAPVRADADSALAVIREGCGTGYFQFAHDIGHIFGANHNIDTTQAPGANEGYAHGYCGNGWRSLMSLNCTSGGGKRVPLWSSPENTFNGEATGLAGESNNVKVLNDNAKRVDNFRCVTAPPQKVTGLKPNRATIADHKLFHYEWKPSANAVKYTIWVKDAANHVFKRTYSSSAAHCASSGCSILAEEMPADGIVHWTVTPENVDGIVGPASDDTIFTVMPGNGNPLPPESLITPSGVITNTTPTFKWTPVNGAAKYKLYAQVNGQPWSAINRWYSPSDVSCPAGSEASCSIAPGVTFPKGSTVRWWVKTHNAVGNSDWSQTKVFTVL